MKRGFHHPLRVPLVLAMIVTVAGSAAGHGELRWGTLEQAEIQRLAGVPAAFQVAPFLPDRLRAARLVQRAGDHLRYDADGDGMCEGLADLVGTDAPQWYVVLRRARREEVLPEIGPADVDTLTMDWRGQGRPSLVLIGHTPSDRVKTTFFQLSVDLDDNGIVDLVVEMHPPRTLFWTISHANFDAALRPEFAAERDRWRIRLAPEMIRAFYETEYFFNHGPEFAVAAMPGACP